jgi:hypothetical protein
MKSSASGLRALAVLIAPDLANIFAIVDLACALEVIEHARVERLTPRYADAVPRTREIGFT